MINIKNISKKDILKDILEVNDNNINIEEFMVLYTERNI